MDFENMPYMLYSDEAGRVYEHPYYRMVGYSGMTPKKVEEEDLIEVPEFSKLFFVPDCPPIGLETDPRDRRVGRLAAFTQRHDRLGPELDPRHLRVGLVGLELERVRIDDPRHRHAGRRTRPEGAHRDEDERGLDRSVRESEEGIAPSRRGAPEASSGTAS